MLCRAGSCQRAAALRVCVDTKPVSMACSKACAEQIRTELIGMPKRAADDDANDDRVELDRVRERRQREEQRFRDLETLSQWLGFLSKIRAKVYTVTPLEVSTATMRIGNRFGDDGTVMAAMLDTLIRRVITIQMNVASGKEYDLGEIVASVRELRNKIADEATIGEFDRLYLTTGERSQLAVIPDGVRRLVAMRADPIQKIAEFLVESDQYTHSWAYMGRIRIGNVEYAYDGTNLGTSSYEYAPGATNGIAYNSLNQAIVALEPRGSWAVTLPSSTTENDLYERSLSSNGNFRTKIGDTISHSSAPTKLFKLLPAAAKTYELDTFCIISASNTTIGVVAKVWRAPHGNARSRPPSIFIRLSIDSATATITDTGVIDDVDRKFNFTGIALDSNGNVWIHHIDGKILIFNTTNQQIAQIDNIVGRSICAAEDGVWIIHDGPGGTHVCTNYRLAPTYNRGLLSA